MLRRGLDEVEVLCQADEVVGSWQGDFQAKRLQLRDRPASDSGHANLVIPGPAHSPREVL